VSRKSKKEYDLHGVYVRQRLSAVLVERNPSDLCVS